MNSDAEFAMSNPYQAPKAGVGPDRFNPDDHIEPITSVSFRLNAEDVKHFREATTSKLIARVLIALFLLMIVSIVATLILAIRNSPREKLGAALTPIAMPLVIIVGVPLFMFMRKRQTDAETPEEITIELTPEGVVVRDGDIGESRRAWKGIGEIRQTKHLIIIFLKRFDPARGRYTETIANVVPLRAFATPEAAVSFVRAARQWQQEMKDGLQPPRG